VHLQRPIHGPIQSIDACRYPVIGVFGAIRILRINLRGAALDIASVMPGPNGRTPAPKAPKAPQLHLCPDCGSDLVQPVAWEQTESSNEWRLWRRCPECEWRGDDVHRETQIDAYDEQLDFGTRELAEELRSLEQTNMQESVDRFIAALQVDLILPEDF
jgi:hypothetical protein